MIKRIAIAICLILGAMGQGFAAEYKISQLPSASSALTTDQIPVNQGGATKKITVQQILNLVSLLGDNLGSATYQDVVGLWANCNGYLKNDGTCATPSGAGTSYTCSPPLACPSDTISVDLSGYAKYRGTWSGSTAYIAYDVVYLSGSSYICKLPHTNHTPPNSTYWDAFAAQGSNGSSGANGNTILYGTATPTTEGANGDFYIRTTTNYIYGPKANGSWPSGISLIGPTGSAGATGSNGTNGTNGNTILYGTAAPTSEGVNGDWYIRTTTNYIYGPKAAGSWPAGISLIGPTGSTGANGSNGVINQIEDEGTPLTQRSNLNFTGSGISCVDSGGKTVCTVTGGGGGSVDDTAYDATSWNGVITIAPSKNTVRDKIEAMQSSIDAKIDSDYSVSITSTPYTATATNLVSVYQWNVASAGTFNLDTSAGLAGKEACLIVPAAYAVTNDATSGGTVTSDGSSAQTFVTDGAIGTWCFQNVGTKAWKVTTRPPRTLPAVAGGTGVTDLTFSGSTHKVATTTGTPATNDCAKFDANGNIVTAGAACGSGAGIPTVITVANEATDTTCFPLFATAATGDLGPKTNSGFSFNPVTGILTATGFSGPLTGNATTASNLSGTPTLPNGTAVADQTQGDNSGKIANTKYVDAGLSGKLSATGSAVAVKLSTGSEPTCNSGSRGTFWYVAGGTGVKDIVEVCAKGADNSYAWRTIY